MHMHESGTLSPPIAASASLHSNQAGLFAPSVRLGMSSPSCNSCGHLLHSPQTPCKVATPPAPVWRKILYEAQPFEDNYTPSTFLSSAELNPNLQHHTFRRIMLSTMPITQQISCTVLFFVVFHYLVRDQLNPPSLMLGNLVSLIVGYVVVALVDWRKPSTEAPAADAAYVASMRASERKRASSSATVDSSEGSPNSSRSWSKAPSTVDVLPPCVDGGWTPVLNACPTIVRSIGAPLFRFWSLCQRVIIFCAVLHMSAPVLRTLTLAFSEDTIAALSLLCSTLHVFLFDYDAVGASNPGFFGTVSLNASIFSSILLASRLQAASHVFAFVTFSFAMFAGMPIVLATIRRASRRLHITTTICLALLAGRALIPISTAIFTSFVICCLVVTFVCPAWLVYFQRFKNEIRGPWDYDDRKELDEL